MLRRVVKILAAQKLGLWGFPARLIDFNPWLLALGF
jgi:hypothetical protein